MLSSWSPSRPRSSLSLPPSPPPPRPPSSSPQSTPPSPTMLWRGGRAAGLRRFRRHRPRPSRRSRRPHRPPRGLLEPALSPAATPRRHDGLVVVVHLHLHHLLLAIIVVAIAPPPAFARQHCRRRHHCLHGSSSISSSPPPSVPSEPSASPSSLRTPRIEFYFYLLCVLRFYLRKAFFRTGDLGILHAYV